MDGYEYRNVEKAVDDLHELNYVGIPTTKVTTIVYRYGVY